MCKKCPNIDTCGFFIGFKGNSEVIKHGWVRLYCENIEKSESCARKKYFMQTNKKPPDNMTPTGSIIESKL